MCLKLSINLSSLKQWQNVGSGDGTSWVSLRAVPLTNYVNVGWLLLRAWFLLLDTEDSNNASLIKGSSEINELRPVKHTEEYLGHPRNKQKNYGLSLITTIIFKRSPSCFYYVQNNQQILYILIMCPVTISSSATLFISQGSLENISNRICLCVFWIDIDI